MMASETTLTKASLKEDKHKNITTATGSSGSHNAKEKSMLN
jgi:hypothetical protein